MAACKPGARKRAAGGHVKGEGEHPPHGGHHMLIIIGMPAKKKKTDGGVVEGLGARQTMGKRARGGPPPRQPPPRQDDDDDDNAEEAAQNRDEEGEPESRRRASGGRTLDAREDECDPDGRDRVNEGEGYDERAHEVTIRRAGGGNVKFRTPSGSVSQGARQQAESKGQSMAGGRFPIRNTADLSNAKHAFGRANDKPAVKRWIDKRARDLGEPPMGGE